MKCKKCGNQVNKKDRFCNNCGERINKNSSPAVIVLLICICVVIFSMILGIIFLYAKDKVGDLDVSDKTFSKTEENTKREKLKKTASTKAAADKTTIEFYNKYIYTDISDAKSVEKIISEESENQEYKYSSDRVVELENELEEKCGITAVNLGEISESLALDITDTVEKMCTDYPCLKNFITNLSLNNDEQNTGAIAVTYPYLRFAYENDVETYPSGQKRAIGLVSSYFLNQEYFEKIIEANVNANHFPKNTTTSSTVAHELGHALMNVARLNKYNVDDDEITYMDKYVSNNVYKFLEDWSNSTLAKEIVEQAYNNLSNTYNSKEEFAESISGYAATKDSYGDIQYEDTIAEAVHDVYLNGDDAQKSSKEIVKILKKYL